MDCLKLLQLAKEMTREKGLSVSPGRKWYRGFKARHRQIRLKKPSKREAARFDVGESHIDKYFCLLEDVLNKIGIKNIPDRIWNLDETAFSCDNNVPKYSLS